MVNSDQKINGQRVTQPRYRSTALFWTVYWVRFTTTIHRFEENKMSTKLDWELNTDDLA